MYPPRIVTSEQDVPFIDADFDADDTLHLAIGPWAASIGPAINVRGIAISWGERFGERTSVEFGVIIR